MSLPFTPQLQNTEKNTIQLIQPLKQSVSHAGVVRLALTARFFFDRNMLMCPNRDGDLSNKNSQILAPWPTFTLQNRHIEDIWTYPTSMDPAVPS